MGVYRKIILSFVPFIIFMACFTFCIPSFAQFFESDEEIGGTVECRFSGGIQKYNKKIKFSNTIVIESTDGLIEFTFDGEALGKNEDVALYVFAPLSRIGEELFLSKIQALHSERTDEAEFSLLRIFSNDDEIEITNIDENGEVEESVVMVKIKKLKNKKASGSIKFRFPGTTLIKDINNNQTSTGNGKVVATCKFSGIPVGSIE